MSTREDSDTDYKALFEALDPSQLNWRRANHRERARKAALTKDRITIRLDKDVLEAFRSLAGDGSYQALINRALREWLDARSVTELVRQEVRLAVRAVAERQGEE